MDEQAAHAILRSLVDLAAQAPTAHHDNAIYRELITTMLARQATPDSDALASDDDRGHAMSASMHSATSTGSRPFPARRGSWMNQDFPQRKFSFSGNSASSQPTTPTIENGPAQHFLTRSLTSASSSSQIARVPSLTPLTPLTPFTPLTHETYNIVHPVRKNVRSLSYSVGQLEDDPQSSIAPVNAVNPALARLRKGTMPLLRHRLSKGSDTPLVATLGNLFEDEDDDADSSNGSPAGVRLPTSLAAQESPDYRPASFRNPLGPPNSTGASRSPIFVSQAENPAALDVASSATIEHTNGNGRFVAPEQQPPVEGNIRRRRTQWQTSNSIDDKALQQESDPLGTATQVPQSRRHSFADFSSAERQTALTMSSLADALEEVEEEGLGISGSPRDFPVNGQQHGVVDTGIENNYFSGHGPMALHAQALSNSYDPPSFAANAYYVHPGSAKTLYMVTFKCNRCEPFYILESTGLKCKKGDIVIVEGDRGIDMGRVIAVDVTIAEGKRIRKECHQDNYRWLMMFSRHAQENGNNGVVNAEANRNGTNGGIGSQLSLPPELTYVETDFKPKMIRRLAQPHEITLLREKEGAEAKAKRVCQQKVADHGLVMEILDAEYQADYKKLTFFYFADSYINFNDLVTDLFKLYKTRIWMSAVNPAAFTASPHAIRDLPTRPPMTSRVLNVPPASQRPYLIPPYGTTDGLPPGRVFDHPMVNQAALRQASEMRYGPPEGQEQRYGAQNHQENWPNFGGHHHQPAFQIPAWLQQPSQAHPLPPPPPRPMNRFDPWNVDWRATAARPQ
ncbi:hypothetical protein H2201_002237 [Coniosporium apollinis]|uniref:PSP1 C-terminal domain-containing protein n=2 Tax=Coniosporium TaxID=2810619 RepID=A0ABQ9P5P0_9PEZI|nr:hypothetical protein H2201_002237 [Coniosporium apollinis]